MYKYVNILLSSICQHCGGAIKKLVSNIHCSSYCGNYIHQATCTKMTRVESFHDVNFLRSIFIVAIKSLMIFLIR